ncbi:MAG: hypothetical protein HZA92_04875 [Verrucomicrobia bacterium]|nr:hypothetical protein [Verrucomicrobiota bacterium]
MKTFLPSVLLLACTLAAAEPTIDWNRAGQLHQRAQRGEKLTPEEQVYYERAKAARAKGSQPSGATQPKWTGHITPLTELGTAKYKGEDGGLYGGGKNEPPPSHLEAALREVAKIQPLDAEGKPAKDGKVVLLSVGMSNTTQSYSRFKQLADRDDAKSPQLVIVDGAQGGQTGMRWADLKTPLWAEVENRLQRAGVSARQVQVIWMKQAEAGPASLGDFPRHALVLKTNLVTSLHNLKAKFPNLRVAYLSSRTYGGYATTGLNPEPYAFETAFAPRWLVQDQIAGKPELNYDAARGPVKAPLLLWGPYLWADGETPRKADGFLYRKEDFANDGTHPTSAGQQKVAELLLKFFKGDATAKWFRKE